MYCECNANINKRNTKRNLHSNKRKETQSLCQISRNEQLLPNGSARGLTDIQHKLFKFHLTYCRMNSSNLKKLFYNHHEIF